MEHDKKYANMLFIFGWTGVAIASVILAVLVVTVLGKYITLPTNTFEALLVIAIALIWFARQIDKANQLKEIDAAFAEHGLVRIFPKEFDSELIAAGKETKPQSLPIKKLKNAWTGAVNDREIVLAHYLFSDSENKEYICCAAWSPEQWPKTIIKNKKFRDKLSKPTKLGVPAFDQSLTLITEQPETMVPLLTPLAEWFRVEQTKAKSFRLQSETETEVQWFFTGHWILLTECSEINTQDMLDMSEYLTTFVNALETQLE